MEKIVVGVDGSAASMDAVEWAVREARAHGARLDVVLAWEFPPPADVYDYPTREDLEVEATAQLAKVMDDLDTTDLAITSRCVEGSPAVVLQAASTDADLLVVGANGHGAFVGMLLGSVSLRVVTHATVPVVVVPCEDSTNPKHHKIGEVHGSKRR